MPFCFVHGHLRPVVHAARGLEGAVWPRVVAELARQRDGVEHPPHLSGAHVVRLHVGRVGLVAGTLRRQRHDDDVVEDAARVARLQRVADVAPQRRAQVDAAIVTKRGNGLAGAGVDGGDVAGVQIDQPAIRPVGAFPVVQAAGADASLVRMGPDLLAGGGVQGHDGVAGALHVHHVVHHDRVEHDRAGDRIGPGHLELRDVRLVDLGQRRELRRMGAAAICRPGGVGLRLRLRPRAPRTGR